jgi:hypothetical protein
MKKAVIFQYRLLHYRLALVKLLREYCVYGLLPFCKGIVLLTNLSTTALVYPASVWGALAIPSHDEYPLTHG